MSLLVNLPHKRALPEHVYKQLYHTFFESHLIYAISYHKSLNQIESLFLTQKKYIQIMFGDKLTNFEHVLENQTLDQSSQSK